MERRHFLASIIAGSMAAASAKSWAQGASTRIIVGAPPGGGTDTVARSLAKAMSEIMGTSFVVENRPGAGGNIAASFVANAAPDGNTLLLCYTSHAINATLYPSLPFDPVADFSPLSYVASAPSILIAHPKFAANTIPELIELARARPGQLNIGMPGIGSAGHLAAEVLKLQTGVDIVTVPYKGTAPALNDVVAGQIDMMFAGLALAGNQIKAGHVKALGVSSIKRVGAYPDIVPIAETLPGYDFNAWYGLLGPAGMDAARSADIAQAARTAMRGAALRERLATEGLIATGSTPEEFKAFLATEITRWGKVVTESGAKAG